MEIDPVTASDRGKIPMEDLLLAVMREDVRSRSTKYVH